MSDRMDATNQLLPILEVEEGEARRVEQELEWNLGKCKSWKSWKMTTYIKALSTFSDV